MSHIKAEMHQIRFLVFAHLSLRWSLTLTGRRQYGTDIAGRRTFSSCHKVEIYGAGWMDGMDLYAEAMSFSRNNLQSLYSCYITRTTFEKKILDVSSRTTAFRSIRHTKSTSTN